MAQETGGVLNVFLVILTVSCIRHPKWYTLYSNSDKIKKKSLVPYVFYFRSLLPKIL